MLKNLTILLAAAVVVALPFLLRQPEEAGNWQEGDPVLTIVTPHNEAIRYEFGLAFSEWHKQMYGKPVKIEWLNVGGTTEISRYLVSEYVAAFRAWWIGQGKSWPAGAAEELVARQPGKHPDLYQRFREVDDPREFSSKIDLFFGGGEYDHTRVHQQGLTVSPWKAGEEPKDLLAQIPESMSGETWRTPYLIGTCVSTFGICYNRDRLRDLGVTAPPSRWVDPTDPVYFGQVGVADPTKSGSIAKAFEMIIQEQMHETVLAAGQPEQNINDWESGRKRAPPEYEFTLAYGWAKGIRVVQLIGANSRYFTDSASKVPIDVAAGDAAVGLAIDFYARFQAQSAGHGQMEYVTPVGGSSVSCDPIGLLRGAPNRAVAVRFIEFVISQEGQALWNSPVGKRCSATKKYALQRLPIRRDFYPDPPGWYCTTEKMADPLINPYDLAKSFTYRPEWTAAYFNIQRDLIRAMCLDSGDELRAAWRAIIENGGPTRQPVAMEMLQRLPVTWSNAREVTKQKDRLTYLREWTEFFRKNYREALTVVRSSDIPVATGRSQNRDRNVAPTRGTT